MGGARSFWASAVATLVNNGSPRARSPWRLDLVSELCLSTSRPASPRLSLSSRLEVEPPIEPPLWVKNVDEFLPVLRFRPLDFFPYLLGLLFQYVSSWYFTLGLGDFCKLDAFFVFRGLLWHRQQANVGPRRSRVGLYAFLNRLICLNY